MLNVPFFSFFLRRLDAANLHWPRSVYAALLAEAKAEAASLNQLCLAKLVARLWALL